MDSAHTPSASPSGTGAADARWGAQEASRKVVSLQELFDAPKGCTTHHSGDAFALHVAWIAPHAAAADELLDALSACAHATRRDTPCVPTYIFRRSPMDDDWPLHSRREGQTGELSSAVLPLTITPTRLGELPAFAEAHRKLSRGIPPPAVRAELVRRRFDPALLDAGPDAPIPAELAAKIRPVVVECTEIYLDEAAFMQHAHSPDYLAAYGRVMNPALMYSTPVTLRLGTPPLSLVERILEPILKERVVPKSPAELLFRAPKLDAGAGHDAQVFGALFVLDQEQEHPSDQPGSELSKDQVLPYQKLQEASVSLLTIPSPLRDQTVRSLCVVRVRESAPHFQSDVYSALALWRLSRAACYITDLQDHVLNSLRDEFAANGLSHVEINPGRVVGYALHPLAAHLTPKE